jgi:putative PIN family toxin of toxin-antitoxin system
VTVSEIMLRYQRLSRKVLPAELSLTPELRDPKDLKILAAAVGAGADAIVTGDKDLLVLGVFKSIPIIDVAEALKRLGLS